MVCDENSEFESQKPLDVHPLSSLSLNPMIPLKEGVGPQPESSIADDLARLDPLTLEVMARRRIVEAKSIKAIEVIIIN